MEAASQARWSEELRALLQELRENALLGALILVGVGIAVLMSTTGWLSGTGRSQSAAIGLFSLILGAWFLRRWNYLAAAWLLVIGSLVGVFGITAWAQLDYVALLVILPVGLATMAISRLSGLAVAGGCTILILNAPETMVPDNQEFRTVALLAVWSVYGMVWLTLQPLITGLGWAWQGYERSQTLLEQARDTRLQLSETLEDLTKANVQLTRLNQRAHALRQMAEDEKRTKERFVANVSHELRTPLNMIIGFSELITQAPETYGWNIPPALLADLRVVLRNSQHLSSLIDDVLDLSQIETGQMALSRERVVLGDILGAATMAVRPLYESKRLYLRTYVPDTLPDIYCDRTRIREVVLNLLTNAGRFTESGGVDLRVTHEDRQIVVAVKDTGPGITEEDQQQRLFQAFGQLDGTIRRRYGGSGLGLVISKQFVEMHGGKMWVESRLGEGAMFSFSLPIDIPTSPERGATTYLVPGWEFRQPTRRSRAPDPVVRPRLAVTEHGDEMRRLLSRYLDEVEVVSFEDLDQALEDIAEVPTTALMINAEPPQEAFKAARMADRLPPGVPAITCFVPGVPEAARAMGQAAYLVKPVSRDALLGALDQLGMGVRTVLVVDDEPDMLRFYGRLLTEAGRGYRVIRASGGRQAIDILHREQVDAMVLDLVMPDMDGFQVIAHKEAHDSLRGIPTLVVSARDPLGRPIASKTLSVAYHDGLSVQQLLTCVQVLTQVLSTAAKPVDPGRLEAPPG